MFYLRVKYLLIKQFGFKLIIQILSLLLSLILNIT